jgi:hypothetical protein
MSHVYPVMFNYLEEGFVYTDMDSPWVLILSQFLAGDIDDGREKVKKVDVLASRMKERVG